MPDLRVKKARPSGHHEIRVPGDRSISHRAVILASLANGPSRIDNFLPAPDCLSTVGALRAIGVRIEFLDENDEPDPDLEASTRLVVHGRHGRFDAPNGPIECGGSATTMRMMAGLLAGQPFDSVLQGDSSLADLSMERVIEPLIAMGCRVEAMGGKGRAPLVIRGQQPEATTHDLAVPCDETKTAVLLAGLRAPGKTSLTEPIPTRDHTERLLGHLQVKLLRERGQLSIYGGQIPEAGDLVVPGDASIAAQWIVAAAATPDTSVTLLDIGLNPLRTTYLRVLVGMGARITESEEGEQCGEPRGKITVRGRSLVGVSVAGDPVHQLLDVVPVLSVAGALAGGRTTIRSCKELRFKRIDRLAAMAENFTRLGRDVVEHHDGIEVEGGSLRGCALDGFGDHRIIMAFAIAGLFAEGETTIANSEVLLESYPDFPEHLRAFGKFK